VDERRHRGLELSLGRVAAEPDVTRPHARSGGRPVLGGDVDERRAVATDDHGREADRERSRRAELRPETGDDLVPEAGAVHDDGLPLDHRYDNPTISPFSSKSMIDAAGRVPRPGMVRISPQMG
jgi:hypothetical protein